MAEKLKRSNMRYSKTKLNSMNTRNNLKQHRLSTRNIKTLSIKSSLSSKTQKKLQFQRRMMFDSVNRSSSN